MADDLKIQITTQADTSGARDAAKSLTDLQGKVKSASEETAKGASSMDRLKEAAKGAAWQIPVLGRAVQALINPFTLLGAVVVAAISEIIRYVQALGQAEKSTAFTVEEVTSLRIAQDRANEAWQNLVKSIKDANKETASTWLERQNSAAKEFLDTTLQLAEAQKGLQLAQINLAQAQGKISPEQAELSRAQVELAFGQFSSEQRIAALRQMIENRKAAIEMAKAEASAAAAQAAAARQAANEAQREIVERAIQAKRADRLGPEEAKDQGWGGWIVNAFTWPFRQQVVEAQEKQRELIAAAQARAAERARRAEAEAAAAQSRAADAAGRLGGLSGGDEIGRLERQIEVIQQLGVLQRRTQVTSFAADREREAREQRERRAAELLREFGAKPRPGEDVAALNAALRDLLIELQRLGATVPEMRRIIEDLRRNGGTPNSRLP
jgi:hypothetical protein